MDAQVMSAPRFVVISNDDGPPHAAESPFVEPFVRTLDASTRWRRGVCLPALQSSWIGKAHLVREVLTTTSYEFSPSETWTLLDAPPAGCVNVALFHLFKEQQPDLVITGPNHGRNTGSAFAVSSGTIGGALEAALCGVRAIAVSFAYFRDEKHTNADLDRACATAVRVIQELWARWPQGVDLFTINVPLHGGVAEFPQVYTTPFSTTSYRSLYRPTDDGRFLFKPDLGPLIKLPGTVGSDVWAIQNRHVSVTPMLASWAEASSSFDLFPRYAGDQ